MRGPTILVLLAAAVAIVLCSGCRSKESRVTTTSQKTPRLTGTEAATVPEEPVTVVGVHGEIKHVISHCVDDEITGKRILLAGEKIAPIPDGRRIRATGFMRRKYWQAEGKGPSPFPDQWVEYLEVTEVEILE